MLNVTGGTTFDSLKEALLKRADVPHSVLTSSDWASPQDDNQSAGLTSPDVSSSPAPPVGRPVSTVTGLFDSLDQVDGDFRRPMAAGLCSSADDLHKTGLTSTVGMRRRFLRSRSHQNILRLDVGSSPHDIREHSTSSTARVFVSRTPGLLPTCVRRPREDADTGFLSASLDLAIRSAGAMILGMSGVHISPSTGPNVCRKSRSTNV